MPHGFPQPGTQTLSAPPDQFAVAATELVAARDLCHQACQWPSRAARANLSALADDSHSNLGWLPAHRALVSHALDPAGRIQLGFSFEDCSLRWFVAGQIEERLELSECSEDSVQAWVDARLAAASLRPLSGATMPYELTVAPDYSGLGEERASAAALGAWFDSAQNALAALVATQGAASVVPVAVRCWPHHFDLAALFVLEEGDPETARSIGVGLSPGDGSFAEPYFYCSPYPAPATDRLSELLEPLFWNREGFVSVILRGSTLNAESDAGELLHAAYAAAHRIV